MRFWARARAVWRDEVKVEKFETPIWSNELGTEEYDILSARQDEVSVDMANDHIEES